MITIIGLIGLLLLVLAYIILITKWYKYFLTIDIIATCCLIMHSIIIKDVIFFFVNALVAITLIIKQTEGDLK